MSVDASERSSAPVVDTSPPNLFSYHNLNNDERWHGPLSIGNGSWPLSSTQGSLDSDGSTVSLFDGGSVVIFTSTSRSLILILLNLPNGQVPSVDSTSGLLLHAQSTTGRRDLCYPLS